MDFLDNDTTNILYFMGFFNSGLLMMTCSRPRILARNAATNVSLFSDFS